MRYDMKLSTEAYDEINLHENRVKLKEKKC